MATFNVAHLITLIGVGSIASSVVVDVQQNQNKTAQNGGGGLKHLFGSDVFTELRDKQNAMAEKMSGIEAKLEKQNENGGGTLALMTMLTSNRLEKEIEDGMRENRNAMAEKMSGIEAKLEKQIENGMRDTQNLLSTKLENGMRENQNALAEKVLGTEAKLENQIENVFTKLRDNQNASVTKLENRIENGMRENQNALVEKVSETEAKLEKEIENGISDSQNLLSTKLEKGMRENQNALVGKVSGTEAKLENQIENVFTKLRDNQNVSVTKLENHIENRMRDTQNLLSTKLENGMRENQNLLAEKVSEIGTKLEQIENAIAEKVSGTEDKLENQIENVFIKLRDKQNALDEKVSGIEIKLENQIENGMHENQNLIAEKMSEIGAKLEQIETGMSDKQNTLVEKVSGIEIKLENQIENVFNDLHNNQNGLATKLGNEIQNNQKALSLMKNMATLALFHFHSLPIYRWNASDCHPGFVINESTNAIQLNATRRENAWFCSCRAGPIHMPSSAGRVGIIYAEYLILAGNLFQIGLSTKEMPLNKLVGNGRVSYGYSDNGKIESTNANGNYANILDNVPYFRVGDVVGCGVNWATRQVFFTKNGQRLNIDNLYIDEDTADLYPTVTLMNHLGAVKANFGPNFKYDLSKEF